MLDILVDLCLLIKGGKRRRTIRWLIRKDFGNICQCGILVQKAEFMLVIPVKIPVIQVNDPVQEKTEFESKVVMLIKVASL